MTEMFLQKSDNLKFKEAEMALIQSRDRGDRWEINFCVFFVHVKSK